MTRTSATRRFRANPVEIVIFGVVSIVFVHSLYNLFYDHESFRPAALSPMSANPISEGRSPASVSVRSFANIELKCESNADQDTTASKVRLTGSLCAPDRFKTNEGVKLMKASITNTANKATAIVFTDVSAGKFSTDYIPLNSGRNSIHVEFSYPEGQTVEQDLTVNKI